MTPTSTHVPVVTPVAAPAGELTPATLGRLVTIRLVAGCSEAPCNFWIGLAASGQQSPTRLMDLPEMGALLAEAASAGISEKGPVMLSDTNMVPPRYVYLLPVPDSGFRERSLWIDDLTQSLTAWAPRTAGFYMAPELVRNAQAQDLLLSTLTALVQNAPTDEYVLLTGAYGLNFLLDVALRLKTEVDGDSVKVAVYH